MAPVTVPVYILRAPPALRPLLFTRSASNGSFREVARNIAPHLPRIAQPSLWKTFIPRFMRRDPSNLMPRGYVHVPFWKRFLANPAGGLIILGMLTGNAAIHIIRIKRDTKLYSRKADQKIELLREVIKRVQSGEDIDVEKLLGTGDPKAEDEWFDVIREIENEEKIMSRAERQRLRREGRKLEAEARDAEEAKKKAASSDDASAAVERPNFA